MGINVQLDLKDVLSLIGALSGISSVIYNLIKWHEDKPKLKITAQVMVPIIGGEVGENNIYIRIANSGKRPIHVTTLGFISQSGQEYFVKPMHLPTILKEAEYVIEMMDIKKLGQCQDNTINSIIVYDVLGERWKPAKKDIIKINTKIRELKSNKK